MARGAVSTQRGRRVSSFLLIFTVVYRDNLISCSPAVKKMFLFFLRFVVISFITLSNHRLTIPPLAWGHGAGPSPTSRLAASSFQAELNATSPRKLGAAAAGVGFHQSRRENRRALGDPGRPESSDPFTGRTGARRERKDQPEPMKAVERWERISLRPLTSQLCIIAMMPCLDV